MTLLIETPDTHKVERSYILSVLVGDFLGLPWRCVSSTRHDVRITLGNQTGELRLPDVLLSASEHDWGTPTSLPQRPLSCWNIYELNQKVCATTSQVPIIYGSQPAHLTKDTARINLPLDIFGSSFFMLSRYEEMVIHERDAHGRFPASASLAYQEGFLERPLVDEYVEILWKAMKMLWPQLERKQSTARTLVSCDVDSPIWFRGSWSSVARQMAEDLLVYRSTRQAARSAISAWRTSRGLFEADPDWAGLQWIMDVNERIGNRVTFYFIPEVTDNLKDDVLSFDDPRIRGLLHQIHARGHDIGVHPGYNSFRDSNMLSRSLSRFREVLDEEEIQQQVIGSRQHFLRWETPTTARLLDRCGIDYDTTLSFADMPGFRCGTCREYPLFDLDQRKVLRLRERPLILMECTVLARRYLNMGFTHEALERMLRLREICYMYKGDFTLLWHNSYFRHPKAKMFYEMLIGGQS